jgi:phage tail sheath protein FI
MEEVSSGSKPIEAVGTAVAAFVGFTERGPLNEPILVTNWTQYTNSFGDFVEGCYLPNALYGYFLNGGGSAYVIRVGSAPADGDSAGNGHPNPGARAAAQPRASAEMVSGDEGAKPTFTVRALAAGREGNDITVEVTDASEPADDKFKLIVRKAGQVEETFDNLTTHRGPTNVITVVRLQSKLITIDEIKGAPLAVPSKGAQITLAGGDLPAIPEVSPGHYVGDTAARTGFSGLEAIEDVTMLCVPDLMAAYQAGSIDAEGVKAVQLAMIAHCELMADRVAILDTPPGLNAQQLKDWRVNFAGYDSKYATLYWPWVKVMDPMSGKAIFMPPSGHVAGIWARNDETRGVHKAPANEVARGVIEVQNNITKGEHDQLNPVGVNCIRAFPGQGIRVWGARTLSSDPEWRYLNVRRLFNFVEKSILSGTNWVVFEPNDQRLWDSVRRTISMFLRRVWRSGALFGQTPAEAFFVKCDEENNPPENRDVGILTVDIGIAPVKPAEFVVFRLSQFSAGAELEE